ncbi:Protein Casp [Manis pentadactyla]|nr:Protein Casp [Manis pentadactyla]
MRNDENNKEKGGDPPPPPPALLKCNLLTHIYRRKSLPDPIPGSELSRQTGTNMEIIHGVEEETILEG